MENQPIFYSFSKSVFLIAALTLALAFCPNSALAFNRCILNDQVTYTDLPCPDAAESSEFTQQVVPPDNPAAAKKRHRANQKKLQKIEKQKIKKEKNYQREARARASQIRKDEARQLKCKELEIKRKAARQQRSEAQLKGNSYATEKARLRVKQAENRYAHYCKS